MTPPVVSKKDVRRTVFQSPKPPAPMLPPSTIPAPKPVETVAKNRPPANRQSLAPTISVSNGNHDDTVSLRANNNLPPKREVNSMPPPSDSMKNSTSNSEKRITDPSF